MTSAIGLLVHAERRHGVARYARELASAVGGSCLVVPERSWASARSVGRVHAHFTDRLWGPTPDAAVDRLLEIAGGRPFSVTLHDLPQASDGTGFARRAAAYRRLVDAADVVVVNSRHEQALLVEVHPDAPGAAVIPLPVRPVAVRRRGDLDRVAGVLGWIYPGKGHRETVAAIAASGAPLRLRALGAPSAGHEGEVEDLLRLGRDLGVGIEVTGYLADRRLHEAAAAAAVPVVAHQHLSASGSINSWIAVGRRPIAISSRYTEEMDALRPGTLTLTTADGLPAAIARAADDPASTMIGSDVPTGPHLDDTAAAYLHLWAGS